MSYASEHPAHCARKDDLGCTESVPGSKWAAIKASEDGWFFSREESAAYCPAHNPPWVAAWRARQAALKASGGAAR